MVASTTVVDIGDGRTITADQIHPALNLAYDEVTGRWYTTKSVLGATISANYVWDTGSLSWIPQTASGGGGGGGAVTIANGADVVEGTLTDAAITTDAAGTISGKLRGLVAILSSVWDSVNGRLKTSEQESTVLTSSGTISLVGDNTILTPAAGKSIRLYYFSLSADAANSAAVTAILKLITAGARYKVSLLAGAIYARNVGAGKYYIQGNINESLIINLSASQSVHWSIEYIEI